MARAPLLQLTGIGLTFGGDPVFSDLDLVIQQGDRAALVGRNGSGKSTLMKVMAGMVEADHGERVLPSGTSVGYMEQHPDLSGFATLGEFAASGLAHGEDYRVERAAEGLKFNPDTPCATASGGERRRAALAKLIAEAPDLMLLDEPTNHLDIEAIAWLEDELKSTRAGFVVISHDRAFLRALTRVTGRAAQISRQGAAAMALESGPKSGKRVVEARNISKTYDSKVILRDFSVLINRGDRVALVGPNGAGKTTLLKLLTGEITPDSGSVKLGTGLEMAVFDQNRSSLDEEASLWENLAGDKELRVSGKADQIMVRGAPKHVVGYLKEFLFDEGQARAPVRSLSGGEKARLILAKIMAKPSNLLVLDEPTNDLDVETLDLLQELIGDYDGTVLLVSHDRDFLDRVAATTIAMEGDGKATIYAGGWSEYIAQRGEAQGEPVKAKPAGKKPAAAKPEKVKEAAPKSGLSFTEKHRLDALPAEIDRLSAEIAKLEELMADPEL
ncbi:MAG: ATP-binding cassette domain-containing protein, partial [Maritimibacter sp.]